MDSRLLKKWNPSFSYCLTSNQLDKDEKSFLAINSPSTISLNTMSYMCISRTMTAILMTSLLGPEAKLRWANLFKLLHMTVIGDLYKISFESMIDSKVILV